MPHNLILWGIIFKEFIMSKFVYKNVNPQKNVEEDCVCRAITLVSNLPYKTVNKLLNLTAEHYRCDKLRVCCYKHLLSDILGYQIKYCDNNEIVSDVINMYPNNKLLIRLDGHLLAAVNGVIYDLFDSSDSYVDCFWIAQ